MKSHVWLLAISFIPFSIFGFLFANLSMHGIKQPDPVVPTVTIPDVLSQTNILFITVDTDAKPNQRLLSVWGLFFSTKTQNAVEIIPLYPSADSLKDTVLISEFFMTQDKRLDEKFLDLTKKAFQVEWNAYVVISQKEIGKISKQLEKDAKITDSNTSSQGPETVLLQQLCSVMITRGPNFDLHHFLDTQVLDHNFSKSILASFDQWIKAGQPFSSCDVQQ